MPIPLTASQILSMEDRIGIIKPNMAMLGIVIKMLAIYNTTFAIVSCLVIYTPIGTPVNMAMTRAMATSLICTNVRMPTRLKLFAKKANGPERNKGSINVEYAIIEKIAPIRINQKSSTVLREEKTMVKVNIPKISHDAQKPYVSATLRVESLK